MTKTKNFSIIILRNEVSILIDRKQQIKEKGFSMNLENSTDEYGNNFRNVDFSKIKVGIKNLDDAIVNL